MQASLLRPCARPARTDQPLAPAAATIGALLRSMRALQGSIAPGCRLHAAAPRALQLQAHAGSRASTRGTGVAPASTHTISPPPTAVSAACGAPAPTSSSLWPAQQCTVTRQHALPAAAGCRHAVHRRHQCTTAAAAHAAPSPPAAAAASGGSLAQQQQQQQQQQIHASEAWLQALRERLQLHNTMSRKKEHFAPRPALGDRVQMYVCGVTVYDYSHIGHARVYVAFDVLYRLLTALRYDVQYVRNFTDIDDKIIQRAAQGGEDPLALAARFADEFHVDMAALGCLRPTLEPRATEHIPAVVDTITRIIANGHAYVLPDGDVYFDVASLPGYGRLSGRSQEDNRAGQRVAVDSRKRGAADFALWKAAKPGEPCWDSPWGAGRPGWHIECSSMISALMGDVIDIHGGGRDLIFPHHENELAQSQAACGCGQPHQHSDGSSGSRGDGAAAAPDVFVRYWLHNGFVNVDSEKMSKSLGNFFTIRDVLQAYHPAALRWFLVSSQYRAPLNYTQHGLEEASDRVFYIYETLASVAHALAAAGEAGAAAAAAADNAVSLQAAAAALAAGGGGSSADSSSKAAGKGGGKGGAAAAEAAALAVGGEVVAGVVAGLLDDLNTPGCVAALSGPLKAINDLLSTKAGRKHPQRLQLLASHQAGLLASLDMLGLAPPDLAATLGELRRLALARAQTNEAEVAEHIAARAKAREAKDFAAADAVRQELAAKGIMLMDSPQGTTWRPGLPEQAAGTA